MIALTGGKHSKTTNDIIKAGIQLPSMIIEMASKVNKSGKKPAYNCHSERHYPCPLLKTEICFGWPFHDEHADQYPGVDTDSPDFVEKHGKGMPVCYQGDDRWNNKNYSQCSPGFMLDTDADE